MRRRSPALVFILCIAAFAPSARADAEPTHGVASEVAQRTATVWARCKRATNLHVALRAGGADVRWLSAPVGAEDDFSGRLTFDDLEPGRSYAYRAWCTATRPADFSASGGEGGRLSIPPAPSAARPVRFVWGGDVGGQNACRDAAEGYGVFDQVHTLAPDFFVALGDLVYADGSCGPRGRYGNEQITGPPPATELAEYRRHWHYNRSDPASQRLLAKTPYYAVWDDHEISTDAGPHHDVSPRAPGRHLLPIARRAFLDFQPIEQPAPRLYRSARWGKHVEVFLLDTRSYRDANLAPDDPAKPKTLLGVEQRSWLIDGVGRSDATWKVIACSVPISVPTSNEQRGRDGWADLDGPGGFENELRAILTAWRERGVQNLIFLSTDIHFASAFRYVPFDDHPGFSFHEFISGPMHAGVFLRHELDPTFHPERLFLHGTAEPITDFAAAKKWFNFGVVEVSERGEMTVSYVDANGKQLWRIELRPSSPTTRRRGD